MDLRSELTEAKAARVVAEREVHDLLLQLHALQLQFHVKQGQAEESDSIKDKLVGRTAVIQSISLCNHLTIVTELLIGCSE